MRNLTTFRVTLLSLALGLAATFLLYQHAWRIPVLQNLRDVRLFTALWIIATPLAAVLTALVRLARWRSALSSGALCLGITTPLYSLGSGFDRVRTSSQDKAVLCNIRQLAAAADQYFLENGTTVVRFEDIVGPNKYIRALNVVAGEDYRANFPFRPGGVLSAEYPSGRIINYATDRTPPDYKNVFEASDPRPSWRAGRTPTPTPTGASTASPVSTPSDENLKRELGQPVHKVRRGTMCASCHANRK